MAGVFLICKARILQYPLGENARTSFSNLGFLTRTSVEK